MLIKRAEVWQTGLADVRIAGGIIGEFGTLDPIPGEKVLDARGGALLPGLHDHHLHMAATAVRSQSIVCGPPEVTTPEELTLRLNQPGKGWLRGILYHESVMGLPTVAELDRIVPDRPVRIQHRSGRMWLLNSLALDLLLQSSAPPPGLRCEGGQFTGHLFDEDDWLRQALGAEPPSFAAVSAELARHGVTGVTDMTVRNDNAMAAHFASQAARGALVQDWLLAGRLDLDTAGPAKLHLHENALPDFDETVRFVRMAHDQGRALASHCTTETELVFTLAALEAAGGMTGDRIEHAGIASDEHIADMARLGLAVVSQPHFIAERGDRYLADVEPDQVALLYRLAAFRNAGITLAAGSDAPYGSLDPWRAMRAAVSRQTDGGVVMRGEEALSPEEAVALYLSDPLDLTRQRRVARGAPANLCLLDSPWGSARERLSSDLVRATIVGGKFVHEAPVERLAGSDPAT